MYLIQKNNNPRGGISVSMNFNEAYRTAGSRKNMFHAVGLEVLSNQFLALCNAGADKLRDHLGLHIRQRIFLNILFSAVNYELL
jgi:hypothetical protein